MCNTLYIRLRDFTVFALPYDIFASLGAGMEIGYAGRISYARSPVGAAYIT
jgi:hypothetical protein